MTINMGNVKKKLLRRFDRTIKEATARAIPVIKKETIKQIANSTTIFDGAIDILTIVALSMGIFILSPTPTKARSIEDAAQTIINVSAENLNLYFGK